MLSVFLVGCVLGMYIAAHLHIQRSQSSSRDKAKSQNHSLAEPAIQLLRWLGHGVWIVYAAFLQQGKVWLIGGIKMKAFSLFFFILCHPIKISMKSYMKFKQFEKSEKFKHFRLKKVKENVW